MMKKKIIRYFLIANISIIVSSVALMCIPICEVDDGGVNAFSVAVAVCFWLGFILAQVFNIKCSRIIERLEKHKKDKGKPFFLTFAVNRPALIADIIMTISVITLGIILFLDIQNQWVIMANIAALFAFINFHCFYNGKTGRYINDIREKQKGEKVK